MFSSLAGMPLSEYIRRRRMTVAAADVLGDRRPAGHRGAVRIRLDRGIRPRVPGGARRQPRRSAPRRRPPSHTTAAQVPPDRRREHHHGHPHRRSTGLPARRPRRSRAAHPRRRQPAHPSAHRLPARSGARSAQGTEQHRTGRTAPGERRRRPRLHRGQRADLPARRRRHRRNAGARRISTRSRFRPAPGRCSAPQGAYPAALQSAWAATATDWFPSNPWRLRPGPSIVAVLDRAADFSTATCELWLPVERA